MSSGGSISDEEWERFLRDAEAGAPGAPEEPSARARMVARRLREEPDRPTGWRVHEPPRPRERKRLWYAIGLPVAAALLLVALAPGWVAGLFGGGSGEGEGEGKNSSPSGPVTNSQAAAQQPTAGEPFRGSPAARWADGKAGIRLPQARATGWMSEPQVAQALARSRDFLVASSLDPKVLRGEHPARAIELINPRQRDVQQYLKHAFREPSEKHDPLLLFSRFDTAKVRLIGETVRTRGKLTLREGERGAVEVAADVTFVYPVTRAASGSDAAARTIVRREVVMSWDDPEKVVTEAGTFSLVSYKEDSTNGGCDNDTGFYVPAFGSASAATERGEGPAVDPYDRSTSMDTRMREAGDTECGRATRP